MTPTDRVNALENLLQRIRENAKAPRPPRARAASANAAPPTNARPSANAAPPTNATPSANAPPTEPGSDLLPESIPPDALITQPPPTVDPGSLRSEPPEEPTLVRNHPPDLEALAAATSGDEPILEVEFDEIEIVDEATLEAGQIPPPRPAVAPPSVDGARREQPADGQTRGAPSPIESMAREAERADAERVAARASNRVAAARAAAEKLAREKAEEKRRAADARERAEAERFERDLEEKERRKTAEKETALAEAARLARESSNRVEAARLAREQAEREAAERNERVRKAELDRIEAQRLEREAAEQAEREEVERRAREQAQREEADRRSREQAEREEADRRAREQAEREEADRRAREQAEHEEADRRSLEEAERVTTETVPTTSEKSGVVEVDAAPISSRQPRADDYPDDGFGNLMDDEQPPESGEVASQRKPTVHDEPTLVASGLAGWVDEEPPARRNVHEAETVLADLASVLRAPPPSGEDATALHTDPRKDVTPPPPAIVNPPTDSRAEMVRRPALAGEAATFVGNLRAQQVVSFGELLDDSLSLAGDDDARPTTQ